jgi:hypothetical protein
LNACSSIAEVAERIEYILALTKESKHCVEITSSSDVDLSAEPNVINLSSFALGSAHEKFNA